MALRAQDDVVYSHTTSGHISGGFGSSQSPKGKVKKHKKMATPVGATSPQAARAQHLLVQANTFLVSAQSEVYAIEGAMKNVRHALDAFQIHLCADTASLKVARMKADLMDMVDAIKNSTSDLEGSSSRLQKAIHGAKRSVHVNQSALHRPLRGCHPFDVLVDMDRHHVTTSRPWPENSLAASSSTSAVDGRAAPPLSLWETLFSPPGTTTLPKEHVSVVFDKLAFHAKPGLGKKDVLVFFRELMHWSLVHGHHGMPFLDRSHNKTHSTRYASILTTAAWEELQSQHLLVAHDNGGPDQPRNYNATDQPDDLGDSPTVVSTARLEEFVTSSTFAHLVHTLSAKLNFASSPPKSAPTRTATPPKDVSSTTAAENTLSMAKLLHDLANAECEAKNGFKLSVRSNAVRSKEFSKAFLTASKELLEKETTLN
ncbi:hypothetical protein, variant [Aphanomyces invadans]|uniref:Uncharacterized protein n=1 Tax=Aphanomyces invadans TaxID=157072 RepID=A0A024U198_9STRA|nr:hypothetical protein, variant [Aphanomyces invadans]ETV99974.1 hypothetical protein, variant [Aphanomyces invadans]|eukprot:XP_008871391.1 hypothetical protein, variant [Aphanomyces invadans]